MVEREATAHELLSAEGALKAALGAALGLATDRAWAPQDIARGLRAALVGTIIAGRQKAREMGRNRALSELRLSPRDLAELEDAAKSDAERARETAGAFVAYWLARLKRARQEGASASEAVRTATKSQMWRVDMVATTEASTAFSSERSRVFGAVADRFIGSLVQPFKVWCSARERNTCGTCLEADGEIRELGEHFSLGEPGAVHPRCLCWSDVVWMPARSRVLAAA